MHWLVSSNFINLYYRFCSLRLDTVLHGFLRTVSGLFMWSCSPSSLRHCSTRPPWYPSPMHFATTGSVSLSVVLSVSLCLSCACPAASARCCGGRWRECWDPHLTGQSATWRLLAPLPLTPASCADTEARTDLPSLQAQETSQALRTCRFPGCTAAGTPRFQALVFPQWLPVGLWWPTLSPQYGNIGSSWMLSVCSIISMYI